MFNDNCLQMGKNNDTELWCNSVWNTSENQCGGSECIKVMDTMAAPTLYVEMEGVILVKPLPCWLTRSAAGVSTRKYL